MRKAFVDCLSLEFVLTRRHYRRLKPLNGGWAAGVGSFILSCTLQVLLQGSTSHYRLSIACLTACMCHTQGPAAHIILQPTLRQASLSPTPPTPNHYLYIPLQNLHVAHTYQGALMVYWLSSPHLHHPCFFTVLSSIVRRILTTLA